MTRLMALCKGDGDDQDAAERIARKARRHPKVMAIDDGVSDRCDVGQEEEPPSRIGDS